MGNGATSRGNRCHFAGIAAATWWERVVSFDNRQVPRVPEPVDDTTSLTGSRIDVGARVGWMLRVHRAAGGLSLRQMAAAMREHGMVVSPASLSRIESEGQRSLVALEGYARVLGLPDGGLRVPVDYLCRSFSYAPPVVLPTPEDSLERFSEACHAVERESPGAGDWLAFSRYHADRVPFGLPAHLMEHHVRRLALELCRSVGLPRFVRYEALLALRRSPYDEVLAEVVGDVLRDPGLQVVDDLVNNVAELPTPAVVAWTARLLQDRSIYLVRAASYAIQSMFVTGGLDLDEWGELPPALDAAWSAAQDDPVRRETLSQLWAALPPPLRTSVTGAGRPDAPAAAGPRVWTRTRQNLHYEFATSLAHDVTARRDLPDDPLLTRLLFEAMFERRGVRMATSTVLLALSPLSTDLVSVLLARRTHGPDGSSAAAVARVAAFCHFSGDLPDGVDSLLSSTDPADFRHALTFLGRSAQPLAPETLARGLRGDELTVRSTLVALGLGGDPRLAEVAVDPAVPAATQGAAGWWLRNGSRVVH